MRLPIAILLALVLFFGSTAPVLAQDKPVIKQVPIKDAPADSGAKMFAAYCAVCHGERGKGDGPAVAALKRPPGDITMLARLNKGKFPAIRVHQILAGKAEITAHGTSDMPMWGELFATLSPTDGARVQQRVHNLTKYIEFLQVK